MVTSPAGAGLPGLKVRFLGEVRKEGAIKALGLNEKTVSGLVDRSNWGPGPWDNEPDRVLWTDAATGFPCAVNRNSLGALCGYVGVGPEHPLYGRLTDGRPLDDILDVHGGITFTGALPHVPDGLWYFGFDCAHAFDRIPKLPMYGSNVYRDLGYVVAEVTSLARQLGARDQEENEEEGAP